MDRGNLRLICLCASLIFLSAFAPCSLTVAQTLQPDERITRLLSSDPAVRGAAKADLLQHPDPALLPALLKELPSSQGTNRDDLLEVLAKYDDPRKVPAFFAMRPWNGNVPDVGEVNQQLSQLGQPAVAALLANCTGDDDSYAQWAAGVLSWMRALGAHALIEAVQSNDSCKHSMGQQGLLYMSDSEDVARADTLLASDAAVDADERIRAAARKFFASFKGNEEYFDGSGIVEALIAAYQANAPSATMVKIAQLLSDTDRPRVTRFMRAAVHSPNPQIQQIAKDYLMRFPSQPKPETDSTQSQEGKIRFVQGVTVDDQDANAKVVPFLSDANADVRAAAASALGTLNTPSTKGQDEPADPDTALAALRNAAHDPSPKVRAAVVAALGNIHQNDDAVILVNALQDSDASVKLAAVIGLEQIPTDSAVPALTQIYRNQQNSEEMRHQALVALQTICNPDSTPLFLELLQASNGMPSQDVAQALACTLKKRADNSAFAPLLKSLQAANPDRMGPQDWFLEASLMNALAETKNAEAFEPLAARTKSPHPSMRRGATGALGVLGDRRAIPLLAQLLSDPERDVRIAAAGSLSAFSNFSAPPELVAALNDADTGIQYSVLNALVASHDPKAVDAMLAAIPKNPGVIYALGESHEARAVPALIAFLQNPANGAGVRSTAAGSLGRLGDARAVEPLIASLREDNGTITMQASAALAMLQDKRAIEPLQQALARWSAGQRPNADTVKVWISQALAQLGIQPDVKRATGVP